MAKKPAKQPAPEAAGEVRRMHRVKVSRVVEVAGFRYKPGVDHAVDDATLALLEAEDAVANVQSAS